jgi:hypothetical protein
MPSSHRYRRSPPPSTIAAAIGAYEFAAPLHPHLAVHQRVVTRFVGGGKRRGAAFGSVNLGTRWSKWKMPVPSWIGMPMMMHSDTPQMASLREWKAACGSRAAWVSDV